MTRLHASTHHECSRISQLDENKEVERARERKRDRSTRRRPEDDRDRAKRRMQAKRDEQADRRAQGYRVIDCFFTVKPQHAVEHRGRVVHNAGRQWLAQYDPDETAAIAQRDWEERVRAGRYVMLSIWPSRACSEEARERCQGKHTFKPAQE